MNVGLFPGKGHARFPVGEATFWPCRRHIPARQHFPDLFGPVADIHHVEGVCGM